MTEPMIVSRSARKFMNRHFALGRHAERGSLRTLKTAAHRSDRRRARSDLRLLGEDYIPTTRRVTSKNVG